jgi:hypothetical protein
MLHTCAGICDVTEILKTFCILAQTKQGPNTHVYFALPLSFRHMIFSRNDKEGCFSTKGVFSWWKVDEKLL